MKTFLWSLFLLIMSLNSMGQIDRGTVSGKITDINGMPVALADIVLQGRSIGTVTDEKGNYVLKVPVGSYIVNVSALGFITVNKSVLIENNATIDLSFKLDHDPNILQDVTITGIKVKTATATRTLLEVKDIPQAISIIGQKEIKEQAAFDLTTVTRNISGLNFTGNYSGSGSSEFFNARGFDLNDAQNYRWNGMMIWNWGNNYEDNIERVEFLKGPASILYGDVTPGGVLNFVTKKPQQEFMANINFKTGSWGLVRPSLDITGPVTADGKLRYRLNTTFQYSNSFRNYVSSRKEFIAPSISWDITPKLTFNAEVTFRKSRNTDDAGLVSPDGTISGLHKLNPSLYLGEPGRQYLYEDYGYFATLSYEISKAWRLKATGFYASTTNRPFGIWFDQPDSAGNFARRGYGLFQRAHNGTGSLEANGTFYTGQVKHNILIGAEYQSTRYRYTNIGTLSLLDTLNIYNPVYGQASTDEPSNSPLQPFVSIIERRGIYLQDQIMLFNEKLHVLLGLRAGSTRQGNHYYQEELPGTDYEGYVDNIITKTIYTPRVGIVYKPWAWNSFYASWSKGYEINSPDIFAKNFKDYMTPPATISTQVELGSKANLISNQLGVTVSLFEINKHNPSGYVYLDPENPNYDEYNVYYQGHHRSRGVEIEANGRLNREVSVTAGVAYTQTRVINDPGYPAGNILPNVPKYTANGWVNYEPVNYLKGLTLGGGIFYKDKFFSSLANNPKLEIPSAYTVDAAIGYSWKQLSAQLNVMNVTNRVSYLNPWQFNLFDVRPLRQFVLTINYRIGTKSR
jgi:iron complex outermembrane receptor protein